MKKAAIPVYRLNRTAATCSVSHYSPPSPSSLPSRIVEDVLTAARRQGCVCCGYRRFTSSENQSASVPRAGDRAPKKRKYIVADG